MTRHHVKLLFYFLFFVLFLLVFFCFLFFFVKLTSSNRDLSIFFLFLILRNKPWIYEITQIATSRMKIRATNLGFELTAVCQREIQDSIDSRSDFEWILFNETTFESFFLFFFTCHQHLVNLDNGKKTRRTNRWSPKFVLVSANRYAPWVMSFSLFVRFRVFQIPFKLE